MSIMEQVKQNLREWYSLAADRTSEMTKISVRMYDKYGISREIERQLSELGCHVYHAVESGRVEFSKDETFHAVVVRIKELERDLAAKIAEIDAIRQQRQQKAAMRHETAPKVDGPVEDMQDMQDMQDDAAGEPPVAAETEDAQPPGGMGRSAARTTSQEAASTPGPDARRDAESGSGDLS